MDKYEVLRNLDAIKDIYREGSPMYLIISRAVNLIVGLMAENEALQQRLYLLAEQEGQDVLKVIRSDDKVLMAVTVSDQMAKDRLECDRIFRETEGEKGKDCDSCSWKDTEIGNVCMCELVDPEQMREKK